MEPGDPEHAHAGTSREARPREAGLDGMQGIRYDLPAMKTVSATVHRRVHAARPGVFLRTADFPGSRSAVETQLSRLVAAGEGLVRVRRGLYWKGVRSRFGPGRPGVDAIVRAVASDRGVGPSGWTASHALGLSTQVPATPAYAVVGAPPTGLPGVKFHSRRNLRRLRLRYHEVALLEVLRDWPESAEADWATLVRRMARDLGAGLLRADRLRSVVAGERMPALRDRFTRLMADLSAPAIAPSTREG